MPQHININDLHKERDKRSAVRSTIYSRILQRCHSKIKSISKLSDICCCFFEVPAYEYGLPTYNQIECVYYVIKELIDDGFKVEYVEPNILFVTWYEKPKQKTLAEISGSLRLPVNDLNLKNTNSYHQKKNSLYHDGLSELELKSNHIFQDNYSQKPRRSQDFNKQNKTFADFNPTRSSPGQDNFKTLSFDSNPMNIGSRRRNTRHANNNYNTKNSNNYDTRNTNNNINNKNYDDKNRRNNDNGFIGYNNNDKNNIKTDGFRSLFDDSKQNSTYNQINQQKSDNIFKPVSLKTLDNDINYLQGRSTTPEPDTSHNIGFSPF
jgi:hypothetical protein